MSSLKQQRYLVILLLAISSTFVAFVCISLLKVGKHTANAEKIPDGLFEEDKFIDDTDLSSISDRKLLLGIFSVASATDIRDTLRSTWLRSRYACPYYYFKNKVKTDAKECVIYYAFVFGNNTVVNETDAIHLPIRENMNEGKTYEWFKYASQHFMDFEYIGKGDQVYFTQNFFFC